MLKIKFYLWQNIYICYDLSKILGNKMNDIYKNWTTKPNGFICESLWYGLVSRSLCPVLCMRQMESGLSLDIRM